MEFLVIPIVLAATVAVALSGYVTVRVGRSLVTVFLEDSEPLPGWLEAAAPLKGRWLRLFLLSPILALLLLFVFSATLYLLSLLLAVVGTILGYLGSAIINALGAR